MEKRSPIVTLQTKLSFSQVLQNVLEFHLPENATIIDPTPGKLYSWEYYMRELRKRQLFPRKQFDLIFIQDDISNFQKTKEHTQGKGLVDALFFDPPYIFGNKAGPDVRREDYGGYNYSMENIRNFLTVANHEFPACLKVAGLVFLKYTDVFSMQERKFHLCVSQWPGLFHNFDVIDHYIIPHHHISPTAWQVKDRPCGIVNYTYLTVFKKKGEEA